MIIRPAAEKDRQKINKIINDSFDRIYAFYARMSFRNLENALVAGENGDPAGIINWRILETGDATLYPSGINLGYLFWLAVSPLERRKGMGENLIKAAIDIIGSREGVSEIYAGVEKKNHASRALIEKLGFKKIRRDYLRTRYGAAGKRIFREMWVMPWEDLFMFSRPLLKFNPGKEPGP